MGAHQDQRWTRGVGPRAPQRGVDRGEIVPVSDRHGVPAIGIETAGAIFRKCDVGAGRKSDVVVVVQADQLAEPQMPGQRRRFRRHALHQVAIADDRVSGVIDHVKPWPVVARGQLRLRDRHADGIGETLPERTGGGLDAWRQAALGMPRRLAAPLAELFDVVQREIVAGQVQEAIKQHRTVSGREHEPIAITPVRIARIVFEQARPQHVSHRRGAKWQPRMTAVRLLYRIHREESHRVDAHLVEFVLHGHSRPPDPRASLVRRNRRMSALVELSCMSAG